MTETAEKPKKKKLGRPRLCEEGQPHQVYTYLPPQLFEFVSAEAEVKGWSLSRVIRRLIEEEIERSEP